MQKTSSLATLQLKNAWLAVGVFDGVHLGHRKLLEPMIRDAHEANAPAVVITFTPHPAYVLAEKNIPCLTTIDERADLLASLGVDVMITLPFTKEFAHTTAEDFMAQLVKHLGLKKLIAGYDTALGRDRAGNIDRLAAIGRTLGYDLVPVAAYGLEDRIISSTLIRSQLIAGDVRSAGSNLGHPYSITGRVIHGDARGRTINIPTANVESPEGKLIPANGVYACYATVRGKRHQAVTNIGVRPTFNDHDLKQRIEAHLMDFSEDVYDADMQLEFIERLRDEQKFSGVDALIAQIKTDITKARELLA
jgi:riboflavin kinase/FMN adenylyltransferase